MYITHDGTGPTAVAGITDACCLLKCYGDDTQDIDLDVTYGSPIRAIGGAGGGTIDPWGNLVKIEHQSGGATGDDTALMDNIRVRINVLAGVTDSGTTTKLRISSFQTDSTPITGASEHRVGMVTLSGNLGSSALSPVKVDYIPPTPIVLAIGPSIRGLHPTKLIDAPNGAVVVKTAVDKAYMEFFGNPTTSTLNIPVVDLIGRRALVKFCVYAAPATDNGDAAASKCHYIEDIVAFYVNAGGGGNVGLVTGSPQRQVEEAFNASNFTLDYTTGTNNMLTLDPGGSHYNVGTGYLRIEMEWKSGPMIR
jgi:hypothetical protein